jgi:enamine deaminase RidA (YjgF/YER057c/UK114 family)
MSQQQHQRADQSPSAQAPGIVRLGMGPTLSEAAICNGIVYLAGQVADDLSKNISGQTAEVLAHVGRLLADVGSDRSRILMCQIFLADIKDFDAMNQVWSGWIAPGHAPPRATVQAKLARPEWLVEIVVTAAVNPA